MVFSEGKGQHADLNITSGQKRCQLAGKQAGVGTGQVYVHIGLDIQTVYSFLKLRNILNFIQEHIGHFPRLKMFQQVFI